MKRTSLFAMAGFLLGLTALGVGALQNRSTGARSGTPIDVHNGVAIAAGPCGGLASASNLADVTGASTPYTVYLPHDELADATSMTVWKCPGTELEFQFPSGINIYLDQNGLSDPGATWKAMAAQDPTDTSVGAVQGQPAAFIDPAKSKGGANGSISFVVGGTWIVVEGNGSIPLSDLIRVTNGLTSSSN